MDKTANSEPCDNDVVRPLCYGDIVQDAHGRLAILQPDNRYDMYVVRVMGMPFTEGRFQRSFLVFPINRLLYATRKVGQGPPQWVPDGTVFEDPKVLETIANPSTMS